MYIIRHKTQQGAFIKEVIVPPRLSVWTKDISEAQTFESVREVNATAEYIQKIAFDVEVTSFDIRQLQLAN